MIAAIEVGKWLLAHWQEVLLAVQGILTAVIALALIIPGDEPEKTLKKIVDVLTKLSKK